MLTNTVTNLIKSIAALLPSQPPCSGLNLWFSQTSIDTSNVGCEKKGFSCPNDLLIFVQLELIILLSMYIKNYLGIIRM